MNFEDAVFLLQLVVFVVVWLLMFSNLMSWGKLFELKYTFISFVVGCLAYGVGFVISIYGYSYGLYTILFWLEVRLFYLLMLFLLLAIIINFSNTIVGKGDRYNANRE